MWVSLNFDLLCRGRETGYPKSAPLKTRVRHPTKIRTRETTLGTQKGTCRSSSVWSPVDSTGGQERTLAAIRRDWRLGMTASDYCEAVESGACKEHPTKSISFAAYFSDLGLLPVTASSSAGLPRSFMYSMACDGTQRCSSVNGMAASLGSSWPRDQRRAPLAMMKDWV